jgi:hypothetical protein
MVSEALVAIGSDGEAALPIRAAELEPTLIDRTTPGLQAFAALVAQHQPA